jgi:hypothetical protein
MSDFYSYFHNVKNAVVHLGVSGTGSYIERKSEG